MATILIVDDRPLDRKYLAKLFGYARHVTIEASDGLVALDLATRHRPDLIITDVLMPGIDGYEFVRRLRRSPDLNRTRVIFFTATYHEAEAQALAARLGVAGVLTKPSEPAEVLALVDRVLCQPATRDVAPPAAFDSEPFEREHARLASEKLFQASRDLESTESRLAMMFDLAQQFTSERDPMRLLERVADAARMMVQADYAGVGLLHGDGQGVAALVTSGLSDRAAADLRASVRLDATLRRVIERRETVQVDFTPERRESLGVPPSHPPISALLMVPLATATRVYGWFALVAGEGRAAFSDADATVARTLGIQAGIAYENASLIAALKGYAEELRTAEERTEYAMTAARAGIWQRDLESGQFTMSRSMKVLLGADDDETTPDSDLVYRDMHPDDAPRVRAAVVGAARDRSDFAVEYRYLRPGGGTLWYQTVGRVATDADGRPRRIVGVTMDVTERRTLEDQLRQAQKMEAVGQLAGGVAHDFNNLLTAMQGYSRFLLDGVTPAQRPDVEEIVRAADRAAALTRQLLAFSRQQVLEPRLLDLNLVIEEMVGMLRRLIGEHLELTTTLSLIPCSVRADRGQLEQVILNLTVNAADAMPRGGRLSIQTTTAIVDERFEEQGFTAEPGRYIVLSVADTGTGMSEETKAHLFEPFFTTKAQGKGTGLGLATVYGIVRQSGGHLRVTSAIDHGSTFSIYLPYVPGASASPHDAPVGSEAVGGSETVLLVEDEESVRGLVEKILRQAGYTVLVATRPAEAVREFERVDGQIDLLLTDVVMPGGTGPDLLASLMPQKPDLRVLFMSGYTDTSVIDLASLERHSGFIQKPFTVEKLTAKIREVLNQ